MSIVVGDITLAAPVLLAPMSGVTDQPFRRLVRSFGAGLVVSEMIASQAMIRQTRESMKMSSGCADEYPMAVQLAGSDPAIMAEAARLNLDRGAALIDINFGCPVKKVVNKACGSALMREPALAARIVDAVVKAVAPVPVTVKMRLGWDDDQRNAPELARLCELAGAQMVTVHGRTRVQLYNGEADWTAVQAVCDGVVVPVIVNGDIQSLPDVDAALRKSGAAGVMIGRGTYGRPWFVRDVMRHMAGAKGLEAPQGAGLGAIVADHYDALLSHYGVHTGVRIARKHLSWYAKTGSLGPAFRAAVNAENDPDAVFRLIDRSFGTGTAVKPALAA